MEGVGSAVTAFASAWSPVCDSALLIEECGRPPRQGSLHLAPRVAVMAAAWAGRISVSKTAPVERGSVYPLRRLRDPKLLFGPPTDYLLLQCEQRINEVERSTDPTMTFRFTPAQTASRRDRAKWKPPGRMVHDAR
jgi:hypothetical protein